MSDLETLPGHLIRRLHQISVAQFTSRMTEAGVDLTSVQYAAMLTLRDHPGLDQQTLAGMIAYDRVTIGGVIERLVQKGLVIREVSPSDRRARVLLLSDPGRSALDAATPLVDEVQTDLLSHLTVDECEVFLRLLQKTTQAGNERSRAPLRLAAKIAST